LLHFARASGDRLIVAVQ